MSSIKRIKLAVLLGFVALASAGLLTGRVAGRAAAAYSSGPPAGFTHAPGEFDCAECHVPEGPGTGQLSVSAPSKYVPGETYRISVTHANASDATRKRWGFQLTALDDAEERAGTLKPVDNFTQTLDNQGPGGKRQYIEHTQPGTFKGQTGGASWSFDWTAPSEDVGPVVFYAAGNQANGDDNTSGDNIYFTFVTASAASAAPDFGLSVSPASRTVTPGSTATYTVTVAPAGGFTGQVALSVSGLPAGASASFSPAAVSLNDASAKTSTLTVTTSSSTPLGAYPFTVSASGGGLDRSAQATLRVVSPASADVSVTKTASPDPAPVGDTLTYTITVTNHGPAAASQVTVTDALPAGVDFVGAGGAPNATQGGCSVGPGAGGTPVVSCLVSTLGVGESRVFNVLLRPLRAGTYTNTATASAHETDPDPANNSSTAGTLVQERAAGPSLVAPGLALRTAVSGLDNPTSMAFIGAGDFLVLEKNTGRVRRVRDGRVQATVLNLAVNGASERGLLGIALHPNFDANHFVYLFWTESSTALDTSNVDEVPPLGNRVDRFLWDGQKLTYDRNIIRLRALQQDAGQPSRGNHNGGVLRFGPDGKLYILMGDNGRRGLLQNVTNGGTVPDDQFGGPEPDDAHLTGVVLRLNDDGTPPTDNPFFNAATGFDGQAATNVRKIFAYGVRNGFGMDFDPASGKLWTQENGDDSFDEINRVEPGMNGGWIQLMGQASRVAQYREIETTRPGGLQQIRWSPSLIATTPEEALQRLFVLPGSHYADPEFSWKYAVAPSPLGFVRGRGLGSAFEGDLVVGASRTTLLGGYLFRFNLSNDRLHLAFDDARLQDRVADNADKFDLAESESLLVGRDFGITTDIRTGPDGHLYVVSLSNGSVYEIYARPTLYVARLDAAHETPPNNSPANGFATLLLDIDETSALVSLGFKDLTSQQTDAHIHGPAPQGTPGPVLFPLPQGQFENFRINLTPGQVSDLKAGLLYVNVHSGNFPAGEIRGQLLSTGGPSLFDFSAPAYSVAENAGHATVTVNRIGDLSMPATVDYTTRDDSANERGDYTTTSGTLRFAAGERSKTFDVFVTDDALPEPDESLRLVLSNPSDGATVNAPVAAATLVVKDNDAAPPASNPVDDVQFFVRQHYVDFLNREPDAPGLAFWTNQITECESRPAAERQGCREIRRINVSAAFFLSTEFQETGYLAYRLYAESFARQPRFAEFIAATQELGRGVVVGTPGWEAQLAANTSAFAERWVARPDFRALYDPLTDAQYVDKLFENARVTPTAAERAALVNGLAADTDSRATVLLKVAANQSFRQAEKNRAFVLMEYFGYLRRNPYDPPDTNYAGYLFWLNKLEAFGGNYIAAEMVKAFITSGEYRQRFGP